MTSIDHITLEVPDPKAAEKFYADAFGLSTPLRFTKAEASSTGFRGFTVSLIVSQPSTVNALYDSAIAAGATSLKPVNKSLWGVGAVVQAPDGAIWKVATSSKKETGPATRAIDKIVVLLGAEDVSASKSVYAEHGFAVGKSFGSYVEFDTAGSAIGLGLYKRRALAKDAGVPEAGTDAHRITLSSDAGAFIDPDGFTWE